MPVSRLRHGPIQGLFGPLNAAETLELAAVVGPPAPPPAYAPVRAPVPDNLAHYTAPSRVEIQDMAGWNGPGYAGAPNPAYPMPIGGNVTWAIDKYLRLVCERVNALCPRRAHGITDIPYCTYIGFAFWLPPPGTFPPVAIRNAAGWDRLTHSVLDTAGLWGAVRHGMLSVVYNVTPRMCRPYVTDRGRTPAVQAAHILMNMIDFRFGPAFPHHTLVVISPIRKTIDYFDDLNGLEALNQNTPVLPRHNPDQKLIGHILNFFSSFIDRTTINHNEFDPRHWKMRYKASAQNPLPAGALAPANETTSAVMVCTTALMIATGHRIDYFNNIPAGMTQAGMINNRRGQIALELHRGRLAILGTPQFVAPTFPEQNVNNLYTSGSIAYKNLTALHCRYGVIEELSRRDRARWYRSGVAPIILLDGIGTRANLIAHGTARGYNPRILRRLKWHQLRDYIEERDYLLRPANANPPSY
ncbi:hypothetical protein NHQ30_008571 [Ciborinia camelliae]|nr:hypothetical protein NHQ30_008571 [Ciborinia camelliae]